MSLQRALGGQFLTPAVIDDDPCAELRSLHDCFSFALVFGSAPDSLGKKDVDGAFFIIVAALDEGIIPKKARQTILCRPPFEEFFSDSLWYKNLRKERAQLRHKFEVIESNDARAVYRTAARPHSY